MCLSHLTSHGPREVDTGYRIGGWRVTKEVPGPRPVCRLCREHPGIDVGRVSEQLEAATEPAEIARHWDQARTLSRGIAWQRLLDAEVFGEPTHDIVTVEVQSRGKGASRKVTGLAVRERKPAWLITEALAFAKSQTIPFDGRRIAQRGFADAYVAGLADPDEFDPYGPECWAPWDWPIEDWSRDIKSERLTYADIRFPMPLVFAVETGASPEYRNVGFIGARDQFLTKGIALQPTNPRRQADFNLQNASSFFINYGPLSRWPVGWQFRYADVISALGS